MSAGENCGSLSNLFEKFSKAAVNPFSFEKFGFNPEEARSNSLYFVVKIQKIPGGDHRD
jgi:hypothetical protein